MLYDYQPMTPARLGAALLASLAACRAAPPAAPPPAARSAPQPVSPSAPADHVTLIFSACVAGQIVPCGCSPDQRGGMPRAAAYVKKLRQADPALLYVDAGDLLFDRPGARKVSTQHELKARTLAQGAELLGAAVRGVGLRDLVLGQEFLRQTAGKVPLLGEAPLVAEAAGVRVGLLESRDGKDLGRPAKELRDKGARLVVLLLHPQGEKWTAAQALLPQAQAAGIDLVVLGSRDDPASDPNLKLAGPPPLLAVEGHGQSLLRVDVHLGAGPLGLAPSASDREAELGALRARIERFRGQLEQNPQRKAQLEAKIRELQERERALAQGPAEQPKAGTTWAEASFVPLTAELGEDEAAQKLVSDYDQKVAELNLAEARRQPESCPAPARGEAVFVGASKCVGCHEEATRFWEQTRHSHAYDTLAKAKKQFSLDCVQCHVTGWQQPGGVCRIDRTEAGGPAVEGHGLGRRDVQCEACHGPGSAHVADGTGKFIRAQVPASFCMRCHEAANSPHFNDAKYRPFIVGPGHGAPLARGQKPAPPPGTPLDR